MHSRARRRGPRSIGNGTVAGRTAALPLLILAVWMMAARAPVLDVLVFTAYVGAGVALPGFVLWRLIGAYRRNLVEDCAAGFAIGTAVQLIVYLASASVGLQQWSWVWAPVVLVVGLLDRDARARVWQRVEAPLAPLTAWLLTISTGLVLLAVYLKGPGRYAPAYADPARSTQDLAFHQALAASAKFDVPIKPLWVAGEPMKYQTFFHQLAAATSWSTGVGLTDLIYALLWVPFALAGCLLVFVLTQRFLTPLKAEPLAGARWAGPLAVLIAGLGGAMQPLHDVALGGAAMALSAYLSPTQNLGVMLALLLAVLAIDVLRKQGPRSRWVLLILVALAAAGAKATVLPLIGCGFGLVFFALLSRRKPTRTAVIGGLAMLAIFVGSVIVVFGGESSGLQVDLGGTFVQLSPYSMLRHGSGVDRSAQLLTAAATLAAWGIAVLGILFLRWFWRDRGVVFLAGAALGGVFATALTSQPGMSQAPFYRTAFPFLAVLSCLGLTRLIGKLEDHRSALLVSAGALAGLAACGVARFGSADQRGLKSPFIWMIATLFAAALIVAVAWKTARRNGSLLTAFLAGLVAACTVGATFLPLAGLVSGHASTLAYGEVAAGGPTSSEADAARWLQKNTPTGDLVATNAHCLVSRGDSCDSRHFWIAALSERQVLVEGWGYTNRVNRLSVATGVNTNLVPYWNRELLATNDAVFTAPSPALIERLRRRGVRWLYADNRAGQVSPNLKQYVRLRQATLDATIYEIR
ncbi:hypothetical protein [Kribbella monticola]|uniref:hypothetical protein n=1 Tax=Kribbella monticola TaxID=2185285 RepID=UPI000DD2F186|nr:hypothetical protein [Kribbella monticola]